MLRIGMSDCGEKNKNYLAYASRLGEADVTILSIAKDNASELEKCNGLILTGGKDVAPELFGDWPDDTVNVDSERDGFEYVLIEKSIAMGIPVLGICRGLQIVNVFLGGTLILDLNKYFNRKHDQVGDGIDRTHRIILTPESELRGYCRADSGVVNSAHHQAPDRIGNDLKITARAEDGTVEALEGTGDLAGKILLVQWHPERMDFSNPFSRGVLEQFKFHLEMTQHSEKYAQWRLQNG